ncbi:PepSY domain-containing protein [Magnetovibrio sp. PR-2]|uniref:PepSY domain-containing protein n=1 Tax=Magnetovibrio sp. PR-2 TaxID=3120356 RepID=UPI002FCE5048
MKLSSWISLVFATCFGAAVLASPAVQADGDKLDQERAREAVLKGEIEPLAKALKVVDKEFGGEVIEVELEDEYGGLIYEIKVLQKDGRVLEVELDAKTLKILDVEH